MKKDRWFLPTNIPNLMMFLTQGLICSPEDSLIYSPNLLEVAPGWIPLQKNKIEIIINENIDFNPSVVIEINLTNIKGEVFDVSTGESTLIKQAAEQNCMFIAAPLPLTCIDKIIFKDIKFKETALIVELEKYFDKGTHLEGFANKKMKIAFENSGIYFPNIS